MPVSEERFPIAQVTRDSRDGWRSFAQRHGTNPTALAEVIGLRLAEVPDELPAWLQDTVEEARQLQSRRSRRSD